MAAPAGTGGDPRDGGRRLAHDRAAGWHPLLSTARLASRWLLGRGAAIRRQAREAGLETACCAEVLAVTYQDMGLLAGSRQLGWYDPGRLWSGDHLSLSAGFRLGGMPQAPAARS